MTSRGFNGQVLGALALLALAGCINEPERRTPAPSLPGNDTPQNTILRLIATYEQRLAPEYAALFTGDFTFDFSSATDPELAQEWSAGWHAADECSAAAHLFSGGVNREGDPVFPALRIDLAFARTLPVDDAGAEDPRRFQVLATRVDAEVEAESANPQDPAFYLLHNSFHRFFLVRGDAAVGLRPSQPADSLHWYVWFWRDETAAALAPAAAPVPTQRSTWGRLKASYR